MESEYKNKLLEIIKANGEMFLYQIERKITIDPIKIQNYLDNLVVQQELQEKIFGQKKVYRYRFEKIRDDIGLGKEGLKLAKKRENEYIYSKELSTNTWVDGRRKFKVRVKNHQDQYLIVICRISKGYIYYDHPLFETELKDFQVNPFELPVLHKYDPYNPRDSPTKWYANEFSFQMPTNSLDNQKQFEKMVKEQIKKFLGKNRLQDHFPI